MPKGSRPRAPRWYLIPVRVVLVTFIGTLIAFAVSLLLGIVGMLAVAWWRGGSVQMTLAYRAIALPSAVVAGSIILVSSVVLEVRHYRQWKTLSGIERVS